MHYTWLATASFGLEGLVKNELRQLELPAKAEMGCVRFEATTEDAYRANLWLRCADRVLLLVGEENVTTFDALFDAVYRMPWHKFLPKDARVLVSGKCARSQLMSVRDCQSITKKAIIEKLKTGHKIKSCSEIGQEYKVDVSLHGDRARITLDSSGDALNKRGYRTYNGAAPLRETLASALVFLSPWHKKMPFHDPCCGTGTLVIEAAMRMANRAPGLNRPFAMEKWGFVERNVLPQIRKEAKDMYDPSLIKDISGSDIDPKALQLAKKHVQQAGLEGKVKLFEKDLRTLQLDNEQAPCFVLNPPYGERLSDVKSCELLYRDLHALRDRHPASRLCVLTSHQGFERCYRGRATQKKRYYNGRLECEYLIY